MATTYAELVAEVQSYLDRPDAQDMIPTWVTFLEADLNNRLDHRKMQARKTASLTSSRLALPADWLYAINIEISGRVPTRLKFRSWSDLDAERDANGGVSGPPLYYTLVGDELEVAPPPSTTPQTVEMIYRARLPGLVSAGTSWLLTERPDLYLFGTLAQAVEWSQGDPRTAVWATKYEQALGAVNAHELRSRYSGGPLVRRMQTFG